MSELERQNQDERLPYYVKKHLRNVTAEFGMQFAYVRRRRIKRLLKNLQAAMEKSDKQLINLTRSDLHQALYELTRDEYLAMGHENWPEWPEGSDDDSNTGWNDDWDAV